MASRPDTMKTICWNVRGLGSPRAAKRLRFLLKQHKPQMVFLMETKIDGKCMERIRRRCGYENGIDVGAEGSRGGIFFAWKAGIMVQLNNFSKNHIDVLVKADNVNQEWRFTGFYGSPYVTNRDDSWNLLRRLGQIQNRPWLMWGIRGCGLHGREGIYRKKNIKERLDRGVANDKWIHLFPKRAIHHLAHSISDHCPLLINTNEETTFKGSPNFKFEAWWTMEESIEQEIKNSWESSNGTIVEKLERLQIRLIRWASFINKGREGLKNKIMKELDELLAGDRDDDTMAKLIDTRVQLNIEIDKDEMYWEQRARANWIQLGNKNYAFFHKHASVRRRINTITRLETEDGRDIFDETAINEAASNYFQNLFSSRGIDNLSHLLRGINSNISSDVNADLLVPFTAEEVFLALKGMGPAKAPGCDGFPALFFQKFWHIIGKDVENFCLGILNEGRDIDSINLTDIVLIPKLPNPMSLVNFRPISLYTVLYKIVVKAIANRLQ
ncbi:hypothetical protein CXB51_032446 [Gossypium anomalum]|uniref:Reverse transcriptase n=1 Tax=Gossypium anomalum TaxID=47600 RepID=A0A8J6CMC6_9ROSI|nr:hypothetical protein CXB51_032446 [Gossypium anomalum]